MSIKGIRNFFAEIQKDITSPSTMRRLGSFVIVTIKDRTRGKGQGVDQPGGNLRRLKRVTPRYAKQRAKTAGRHPEAATGTASNLTLRGTLLDSMLVKRATTSSILIGFKSRKEDLKTEGQQIRGRRFLVLSASEMITARKYLAKIVSGK